MSTTALLTLGNLYISDFLRPDQEDKERHELALFMDEDGAVRLEKHIPVNKMFGKYWYRSGTNESMRRALKDVVDSILSLRPKSDKTWLDIASNDGTLLSYVPKEYYRIGIDPCEDSFLEEAKSHSDCIVQDYFSSKYMKDMGTKADVITTIAMFYDIVDREQFLNDVYEVLKDDGLWVLQLSYTPLMLKQMAFDNICHEHYYYYSLFNIKKLLERNDFVIRDVQLNTVNGGSFRLYVQKNVSDETKYADQPSRDVCNMRIESLLAYEKTLDLDAPFTWLEFMSDIVKLRNEVREFIVTEKKRGKTIWGYGASTKGNTLLQYFELDNTLIDAIADRSEYKHGTRTVGTNIPIVSEDEMRKANPDYLLILPWHFITEFERRESAYLNAGGRFIVPCPKLKIIKRTPDEIRNYVYSQTHQETSDKIEKYINNKIS